MKNIDCYHTPTSTIDGNIKEVRCTKCNELLLTFVLDIKDWIPINYEKK